MIRVDAIQPARVYRIDEISPSAAPSAPILPIRYSSSTIEIAAPAEKETSRIRPKLKEPEKPEIHFMLPLLRIQSEMERLQQKEGAVCEIETTAAMERMQALNVKRMELLRNHAQAIASKQSWSALQTVAQYVASVSSIVLGAAIVSIAPVASWFLIASGAIGLLNRAMTDTGGWQWIVSRFTASKEQQIKIAEWIDSTAVYLSMALSVCGAIGAYQAGAFSLLTQTGRDAIMNKIMQIVTLSSGALQAVSRLGIAQAERNVSYFKAALKESEAASFQAREDVQANVGHLRKMIEITEAISDAVKSAINSITP
jgi:hypothetical protein